jgi:hypothetical protein
MIQAPEQVLSLDLSCFVNLQLFLSLGVDQGANFFSLINVYPSVTLYFIALFALLQLVF